MASYQRVIYFQAIKEVQLRINEFISNPDVIAISISATDRGNKYDVAVAGKTVPVNYNIIQGTLVGILGDPTRHSLNVAVNPGPTGGALEIQVPRYLVDSKTPTNTDKPFVFLSMVKG
jgi:hypothetical protein